ncbi:MAG TPA: hypothetical protein VIX39_06665 [Actinomycetota bacterium]
MAEGFTAGLTEARERRVDIASAALLAIATVLAAWSAFQSAKWSGEQATAYSEAAAARQESVRNSTLAGQLTIIDVSVFEQYVDAYAAGDERLQNFYLERARDEFKPALEAWIALEPAEDPEAAPGTPFEMPEYQLEANAEADRLEREAAARFQEALTDNQRADNYVLLTVLFASVLLFAGLAPKSRRYSMQVMMISTAVVMLVVGVVLLLALPKTF